VVSDDFLFLLLFYAAKINYISQFCYRNIVIFDRNFNKMSIGTKVRYYRHIKSLSQSDLAIKSGISQSIISSLEADKTVPNSVMLHRIAQELEVDINDLLKDENVVQNNFDKAIGNIYSQVTINNHFPENVLNVLLSNQEKITNLIEAQNKFMETLLSHLTQQK
jgi:transcriptional regulator with XRE-family HTH domain